MRCLVVDDEKSALHLFFDNVIGIDQDIEFHYYLDDVEKIEKSIISNNIDAIFMDIKMPRINGIDLASELIKVKNSLKIVFITGLDISYKQLPLSILNNVVDILYKPLDNEKLIDVIAKLKNAKKILNVQMFNTFECFINNRMVMFSSSKSKELFALLLSQNGKSLQMEHAITLLWPDKELDKAKILYRDAVWRLRATLKEIDFNCVEFRRANLLLNKENIDCDYYRYLDGDLSAYSSFFCSTYDWSLDIEQKNQQMYKELTKNK